MSQNDTFVSGPSGAGYWHPKENPSCIEEYLKVTKCYLAKSGLKYVEILGFTDDAAREYIKNLDLIAIKKSMVLSMDRTLITWTLQYPLL